MSMCMQRQSLLNLGAKFLRICFLSLLIASSTASQALADVKKEDGLKLQNVSMPMYQWENDSGKPRAVAILIHGLTMHGGIFDKLARHLAEQGYKVIAPDLHGYGRWADLPQEERICKECGAQVCYQKSRRELLELIDEVKAANPSLPLYMIGESLGADMVLYSASMRPKIIDGIVLSSPAIKRRFNLVPRVMRDMCLIAHNPFRQVDLVPYMKKFASEDQRIIDEAVNDRLVRKKLTTWELFKTVHTMRPSLQYADKVPANMPVLVIQGDNDRMLKSNAVCDLLKHLSTQDQTVRWFHDRGHLLLETAYVQPDTLNTVEGWLNEHLTGGKMASATVTGTLKDPSRDESVSNN